MLKNLTVLVTGAAGILGSATAKKLISEGCKVSLLDLPDSKGKDLENKLGKNALFVPGNVTSEEDVNRALDVTIEKFGNLKGVVNCASVHRAGQIYNFNKEKSMKFSLLKEVLDVNVCGMVNVIRLGVRRMDENPHDGNTRGVIINTSGFGAYDGQSGQTILSASWGAISSMTLPLSRELGEKGIRVMAIAPGLMESNLTNFWTSKLVQTFSALTPSPKRLGYREEFADLVAAIIKNDFLNGEVIRLNGGLRLNL